MYCAVLFVAFLSLASALREKNNRGYIDIPNEGYGMNDGYGPGPNKKDGYGPDLNGYGPDTNGKYGYEIVDGYKNEKNGYIDIHTDGYGVQDGYGPDPKKKDGYGHEPNGYGPDPNGKDAYGHESNGYGPDLKKNGYGPEQGYGPNTKKKDGYGAMDIYKKTGNGYGDHYYYGKQKPECYKDKECYKGEICSYGFCVPGCKDPCSVFDYRKAKCISKCNKRAKCLFSRSKKHYGYTCVCLRCPGMNGYDKAFNCKPPKYLKGLCFMSLKSKKLVFPKKSRGRGYKDRHGKKDTGYDRKNRYSKKAVW